MKPKTDLNLAIICQMFSWLNIIAHGFDIRGVHSYSAHSVPHTQYIQRHHPIVVISIDALVCVNTHAHIGMQCCCRSRFVVYWFVCTHSALIDIHIGQCTKLYRIFTAHIHILCLFRLLLRLLLLLTYSIRPQCKLVFQYFVIELSKKIGNFQSFKSKKDLILKITVCESRRYSYAIPFFEVWQRHLM